ncbi:syntaxin Vam3p [[Candida] railenensis]|uniref:Syntaxin Vam3p n=1 Tax=[Candida] railenensis TaxID=45579 RepID=A0A9P0VY38_9ASCO|nr:syntaxin Vam3p [[Candida] railenensis]
MSFANFDYEAQKPLQKNGSAQSESQNELDSIIEKTSKQLESFGSLVSQFDTQRKQIGSRRDGARLRSNIDILIDKISNLDSVINILIENISSVVNKNQTGSGKSLTITDKQIVIKERLEIEYSRLHKEFQVLTRTYKEKKRAVPIKETIDAVAAPSDEQSPLLHQASGQQLTQEQLQVQRDEINESELQYHLLLTEERNQEINQINEGIVEINSIFKDLGELVHQQGDQLDTIEENILQLHGHTQQAEQELVKANEYQRKKGKWSCIVLVALCVFILIVVLAVLS